VLLYVGAGLAVSDALFCIAVLPRAYIGAAAFGFRRYDVRVVYTAYGDALVNTFIVSSTWSSPLVRRLTRIPVRSPIRLPILSAI